MKYYDNKTTGHAYMLHLADDGFGNLIDTPIGLFTFNWFDCWNSCVATFYDNY